MLSLATNGPLIVFIAVAAGSLGIPIPAFAAVIFAGSLLAQQGSGVAAGAITFAAALAGAVLGDVVWFFAGRRYGTAVLGMICRLSLSRDSCVRHTADAFERRGMKVLLVARFFPGLSVISTPLAGISGVSLARFAAYAETGAAIWIATGLALGLLFANQVSTILHMMARFGLDLGGLAAVLIVAYVGVALFRRWRLRRALHMARVSVVELAAIMQAGAALTVIDVRSQIEREADPFIIPGAHLVNAAHRHSSHGVSPLKPVIIYCSCPNEVSAAVFAQRLRHDGYADARPLLGGLEAWRQAGHPVALLPSPQAAEVLVEA